jgi:hypothetical protein
MSARRPRDEDEDDRPRRRARSRDDDDGEDERPRRKSRRAKPEDEIPEDTPRVYKHKKCGCKVRMSDDVILTYLDDPFYYTEFTHCPRCGGDVPRRECVWVETRQRMDEYFEDLQAEAIISGRHEYKLPGPPWFYILIPPAPLVGLALAMAKDIGISNIAAILIALAVGLPIGFIWTWFQWKKDQRVAIRYKNRIIKNYKQRRSSRKAALDD